MSQPSALWQWVEVVSSRMPQLSKPQAVVLAWYSFGMVVTQSSGRSTVAGFLAGVLGKSEDSLRQRLREWSYGADDKKGSRRQEIVVSSCFGGLLRWILSWWSSEEQRLALALDATHLGQRFTVLAVSVVYRGCALPVAWSVVYETQPGAWKPHWLALLGELEGCLPTSWTVIVLTDRGLYAKWLYQAIQQRGWHPFMRLNNQGTVRPQGEMRFRPLKGMVTRGGPDWSGEVDCFVTPAARLPCTLLASWDPVYTDPWLIVTDLAPHAASVTWYGMRTWIEAGFKDLKRGGWHWEQTKMTDPERASRLWLAMAVATLWIVSVGGEADLHLPASSLAALPTPLAGHSASRRSRPRLLSCFRRGLVVILAALVCGEPLPLGCFVPEPWPDSLPLHAVG